MYSIFIRNQFLHPYCALLLLLLLFFGTIPFAVAEKPKWEAFTLENGLQVVVVPDRRVPVVTHVIAYKVGAADEPEGQSGKAHFFEHLMFKATKNHEAGELDTYVNSVGGEHNAYTDRDMTVYYQQVPSDSLPTMMAFEADRMRNLILSDDVVETERQVILEERTMRVDNEPGGILSEQVNEALYERHPYRRPIIGSRAEIAGVTRQQLIDFYNLYYQPGDAVVVVAGDVDTAEVRALAESTYGKLPAGPAAPARVHVDEPEHRPGQTIRLEDDRITNPSFRHIWHVPSQLSDERAASDALYVMGNILAGGSRSRLYLKLVVKDRIASGVWAGLSDSRDFGEFSIVADPLTPDLLDQVEAEIRAELEKIIRDGVEEHELAVAKKVYASSLVFGRDNQMSRAMNYATQLAAGAPLEELDDGLERVDAVSADAIRKAAADYLDPDGGVKAYLLPKTSEAAAQ